MLATNKKAFRDYEILEKLEAGIALMGSEIKSVRMGKVQLSDGFVRIEPDGAYLYNVDIAPYEQARSYTHEPKRKRKLLLHRRELERVRGRMAERGLTCIPLKMYLKKNRWAKVEIAVAKGKRLYDKRRQLKKRIEEREKQRALSYRSKTLT